MAFTEAIGFECKLYYNSATHASPTWVEIKRAQDVSVTLNKAKADLSRREVRFKLQRGAMIEAAIEFGYIHKVGTDTVLAALRDSFLNSTTLEFAVMDGPIATTGQQGLRMYGEVMDYPYEQALEAGQTYKIKVEPAPHEEPAGTLITPDWYVAP